MACFRCTDCGKFVDIDQCVEDYHVNEITNKEYCTVCATERGVIDEDGNNLTEGKRNV